MAYPCRRRLQRLKMKASGFSDSYARDTTFLFVGACSAKSAVVGNPCRQTGRAAFYARTATRAFPRFRGHRT